MPKKKVKSLNYYFLQKHLHPKSPLGFRQVVVNVIINQNDTENRGKFLFIQENNKLWGFPKQGIEGRELIDGFYDAMAQNLGEELGFRGMKIIDLKPQFAQKSYIFNFEKQVFGDARSEHEMEKGRPAKGKIYHLAIMEYMGPEELPIDLKDPKITTRDYKWVTETEGRNLIHSNIGVGKEQFEDEEGNPNKFHISFYERIVNAYNQVLRIFSEKNPYQQTLL